MYSQDSDTLRLYFAHLKVSGGTKQLQKRYDAKTLKYDRFISTDAQELNYALLSNGFLAFQERILRQMTPYMSRLIVGLAISGLA